MKEKGLIIKIKSYIYFIYLKADCALFFPNPILLNPKRIAGIFCRSMIHNDGENISFLTLTLPAC